MPRHVVFLRAVNVGGRKLTMADARKVLEDNGFSEVESHIQTGNFLVVSPMRTSAKVEQVVGEVLGEHAGYDIVAIARSPGDLTSLVETVDAVPVSLEGEQSRYVSFCTKAPTAARAAELEAWDTPGERALVMGKDVLLEFALAFHTAKLTGPRIEKVLGVPGTARNMTVVRALAQKWGT
ncbi:DUF1697 domain-containing protein [Pedococcus aerophilus]|uniref:DUF1697 domain-containing protein n=1 Tax=Pedococcus aerophilus TaxID=436356 RepID=A0ABN3UHM8_9MICO